MAHDNEETFPTFLDTRRAMEGISGVHCAFPVFL